MKIDIESNPLDIYNHRMKRLTPDEKRIVRKLGSIGGKTAAKNMTPEQLSERARKAVSAREAKRAARATRTPIVTKETKASVGGNINKTMRAAPNADRRLNPNAGPLQFREVTRLGQTYVLSDISADTTSQTAITWIHLEDAISEINQYKSKYSVTIKPEQILADWPCIQAVHPSSDELNALTAESPTDSDKWIVGVLEERLRHAARLDSETIKKYGRYRRRIRELMKAKAQ